MHLCNDLRFCSLFQRDVNFLNCSRYVVDDARQLGLICRTKSYDKCNEFSMFRTNCVSLYGNWSSNRRRA